MAELAQHISMVIHYNLWWGGENVNELISFPDCQANTDRYGTVNSWHCDAYSLAVIGSTPNSVSSDDVILSDTILHTFPPVALQNKSFLRKLPPSLFLEAQEIDDRSCKSLESCPQIG